MSNYRDGQELTGPDGGRYVLVSRVALKPADDDGNTQVAEPYWIVSALDDQRTSPLLKERPGVKAVTEDVLDADYQSTGHAPGA